MGFLVNCPAKINLFLQINNKRSDGYHNLQSLFLPINLHDVLHLKKSSSFSLNVVGKYQHQITTTNIISEIWQYFINNFAVNSNLTITLEKNIPVGAGLGGGSSNGSAFILALNQLFSLNLSTEKLLEISLKFGSDLPFFIIGKPAFVFGRGQEIVPITKPLPKLPILLINPQINLSTAKVFANNINFSQPLALDYLQNLSFANLLALGNNLQDSAIKLAPQIGEVLSCLKKFQPLSAAMSGSGSSCFAVFDNQTNCQEAYNFFCNTFANYLITIV